MAMLGSNPTQEHFRLAAYYLIDLAFQASGAEPLAWGCSWSGTPPCTPVDSRAFGQHGDSLREQATTDPRPPGHRDNPGGTDDAPA
jgi:hypothetical protein